MAHGLMVVTNRPVHIFVARAPCFRALRNAGPHGLPELANHVHLCSPYINTDHIAKPQDHSLEGQGEDRD